MASVIESDLPLGISSEHASAVACSASCYDRPKDVRILSVIVTERKLSQVQGQVVFGDIMERPHDAPLQERPETFNVIRMHLAPHVFASAMTDGLVREPRVQGVIGLVFVSGDQIDALRDGLPDKAIQRRNLRVFDDLRHDVAFSGNRSDHGDFAFRATTAATLRPMAVLIFAADKGFVNLHCSGELRKLPAVHRGPYPMAQIPRRPVVPASDLAVNLHGANALFALRHQVDDLEPCAKWVVGVLENGLAHDRKPVPVLTAAIFVLADPMEGPRLEGIYLLITTARTAHAVGPALFLQILFTGFLSRKAGHQCGQGHSRLGRHGILPLSKESIAPLGAGVKYNIIA